MTIPASQATASIAEPDRLELPGPLAPALRAARAAHAGARGDDHAAHGRAADGRARRAPTAISAAIGDARATAHEQAGVARPRPRPARAAGRDRRRRRPPRRARGRPGRWRSPGRPRRAPPPGPGPRRTTGSAPAAPNQPKTGRSGIPSANGSHDQAVPLATQVVAVADRRGPRPRAPTVAEPGRDRQREPDERGRRRPRPAPSRARHEAGRDRLAAACARRRAARRRGR